MRRRLIAANWKMHSAPSAAFIDSTQNPYREHTDFDVIVFPVATEIEKCLHARLITGAQYGRAEHEGAFTGDISMRMLKQLGCTYVLCGHSERREHHAETDSDIIAQVTAALEVGLHPIVCVGETAAGRKAKKHEAIIKKQMRDLPLKSDITIAYEPVWAVGTGKNATPDQAQGMHAFIRNQLPEERREQTRIIYGGSVNADNAAVLVGQKDIDGFLVGGASLDDGEFGKIVKAAQAS